MLLPLLPLLAAMAADAQPVTVELYDVNHNESATIQIGRDGSVDAKTAKVIKHICHAAPATASPTSSAMATPQASHMKVTWRRGTPIRATRSAAAIEPAPPTASTVPKVAACA